MEIEQIILSNLVLNEEFARKVNSFILPEYFIAGNSINKRVYSQLFEVYDTFFTKYNNLPTKEALKVEIEAVGLEGDEYTTACEIINSLDIKENTDMQWLIDKTEKFCQESAIYNSIITSMEILNGKEKKLDKGAIPKLMQDALAVSFNTNIGHDYFEDAQKQYDFYHRIEDKLPFDLEWFNLITRGGVTKKTLNIIIAGINVGKSLAMCHMATFNLSSVKNVLYITMEMSEEMIRQRIDANFLNIDIDELEKMPKEMYFKAIERKKKHAGRLIIKEYPTTQAGSAHFRHLLRELKAKKNFKPDAIYIDYLNLCMSSRLKYNANVNSYTYVKMVSEEIRGLGVEFDVPIISATQFNREGYGSSEPDMTNTAESFGLPATADLMVAMITAEELEQLSQYQFKQLKNRYYDVAKNKKWIIGVDKSHMRLYNLEASAQEDVIDGDLGVDSKENTSRDLFEDFK